MISRNSEGGFFAAHWDWLVAAAGVVALVVGVVLFAVDPYACKKIIEQLPAVMEKYGVKTLKDIIGGAH